MSCNYSIVDLRQDAKEWLSWRKRHICASDSPAILGKSPYRTMLELYYDKVMGEVLDSPSDSMKKGKEMEPEIRAWAESELGIEFVPMCVESRANPLFAASLDGLSFCGSAFIECKFNNRENHGLVKKGKLPEFHMIQMQHQWGVLGEEADRKGYYISHHQGENILVEIKRDAGVWNQIVEEGEKFWQYVEHKSPPELSDDDYFIVTNPELLGKAEQLAIIQAQLRDLEKQEDWLKKEIIQEVGRNAKIGPLTLTKSKRKGAIDFDSIPAMHGVDLEPYRKPHTEYFTLK